MSQAQIEIMIIASVVAVACSLVGVFLNLRKMAMMSDAITHTVLLGIVLAFFATHDLNSPLLMVGAVLMGVLTVYVIESLQQTRLLSEEASIGVTFPFIFSIAIVLISKYAGSVHLDTDTVLLGELVFAPLDRMVLGGISVPVALVSGGVILVINMFFVAMFYKELKLSSFDPVLAATLGCSPVLLNYLLMSLVAVTSVGAFNAVGSILVIAFMVGPGITAYLLTQKLSRQLAYSVIIAIGNSLIGYQFARYFDVSIAGSMAFVTGVTFLAVFLFSRREGYITKILRQRNQKKEFAELVVLFHLYNHSKTPSNKVMSEGTIHDSINWNKGKMQKILSHLEEQKLLSITNGNIYISDDGIKKTEDYMVTIFER